MKYFMTTLIISSITMSAISLIYILLAPLLKKRYTTNTIYYGWLIIILGLIIPFRPQFDNPLININALVTKDLVTNNLVTNNLVTDTNKLANINTDFSPILDTVEKSSELINTYEVQWFTIAFIIWLTGVTSFTIYHVVKHLRFTSMVNKWSEDIDSYELHNALRNLKQELNISNNINIKQCPMVSSPMLIGLFNPTILLPNDSLSAEGVDFILRHELIHYKRKDLLYKFLIMLSMIIHWFNPVVYLISSLINKQCEFSCDEKVSDSLGLCERKLYASIIVNASKKQLLHQTALSTTFFGGKEDMKKRILNIMNYSSKRYGLITLCLIIIATIATSKVLAISSTDMKDAPKMMIMTEAEQTNDIYNQDRIKKIKQECAIYEKYGLTYNEDTDTFSFNNKTVKCLIDKLDDKNSFYYINRPTGELVLKAQRNELYELIGIITINQTEYNNMIGDKPFLMDENETPVESTKTTNTIKPALTNDSDDEYSIYKKYGLVYDESKDMLYYNGESVKVFFDEVTKDKYKFITRPNGNINIKAIRNENNELTGIKYIDDDEYANLFGINN